MQGLGELRENVYALSTGTFDWWMRFTQWASEVGATVSVADLRERLKPFGMASDVEDLLILSWATLADRQWVRHGNRIKGLLFAQGISDYEPLRRNRRPRLEELTSGDGRALPAHLKAQIGRELDRLELLLEQLKAVEAERDALLERVGDAAPEPVAALARLRGIGPEFAAVLWLECLFRPFGNRRQVAAYAGLAPTPWQSGSVRHEQGVSKSGNPRLRTTMVQLAWLWLRNQPASALSLWFRGRVKRDGGRGKKATIVALARKLLVALWKFTGDGIVIEGAVMKAA